jgi:protein required for attachment to host cells
MVRPETPLQAESYWVVVADEYKSIFYARDKKFSPLKELSSLQNETAREKTGDLISDRGGRAFDSFGQGRHTMASEKGDPKAHSAVVFAKEIADKASAAKKRGSFDKLIVVAAPRFLGLLRPALATAGIEPDRTIDKQVVGKDASFIKNLIDAGYS